MFGDSRKFAHSVRGVRRFCCCCCSMEVRLPNGAQRPGRLMVFGYLCTSRKFKLQRRYLSVEVECTGTDWTAVYRCRLFRAWPALLFPLTLTPVVRLASPDDRRTVDRRKLLLADDTAVARLLSYPVSSYVSRLVVCWLLVAVTCTDRCLTYVDQRVGRL